MATASLSVSLPAVGEIGDIPVGMIRPFKGQPRKHFDEQALRELGESIAAEGQRTPAWVMPVRGGFEWIAGERRWRACRMAGIPALRCEVRAPENAAEQYVDSVMENFGRKDCTPLEAARAVSEVIRLRFGGQTNLEKGTISKVAKIFVRTEAWVYQHLSLLRLHPDVLKLLEEPQRIPTAVAISLANLRPELQVSLASEILNRGLRPKSALSLVRNSVTQKDRVVSRGKRGRRPSDDFLILKRFVVSLGEQAEVILSTPKDRLSAIFAHRKRSDLETIRKVLQKRIEQLQKLDRALEEISR